MRLHSAGIDWVSFDTAFSAYQRHQHCHLCSGSRKQLRQTFTTSKEIDSKIIILQGDDCHTVCIYTSMCFLLFLSSYIDCALWCGLRFTLNHCLRSGLSNMWPVDQNLPTKETNLVNRSIANTLRIGRPSIMGKIQWDKKITALKPI